ncbi:Metal ion transporter, metal ion (Mn2+/Fe2+) transporter (Nramp) family [Burkholderiales bacterium]|nr:Metal ion transporter, metal ion (Mn2+/Fe2+) transporter (Nramp) family [Burkholderiales bacterium]
MASPRPTADRSLGWRRVSLALGPGLVVMLADTDAGSVITAAQSGAQWGYQLLMLQFLIIPILFAVQELTVRLGLATGKGLGELVLQRFGRTWAVLSMATLVVSCFGALVTQMSGLAGVGQMFGVPIWQTITLLVILIFAMVCTGSYHSVERIAILLGLFELAFLVVAWKANPDRGEMLAEVQHVPLTDSGYLYLLAANLGTSIMPWTVFYQQSALIGKGLTIDHIRLARFDTFFGAILCQMITAAVLIAAAATVGRHGHGVSLDSVPEIANAFTAALGDTTGRVVFAIGLSGGALVATIVVCLTASWTIGEVTGFRHSLEHHPFEAPWFYSAFAVILVGGGVLVASGVNLVRLSIATGVINALLLPVVLGFLYLLALNALPDPYRLKGSYAKIIGLLFLATAGMGLYAGIFGALA